MHAACAGLVFKILVEADLKIYQVSGIARNPKRLLRSMVGGREGLLHIFNTEFFLNAHSFVL